MSAAGRGWAIGVPHTSSYWGSRTLPTAPALPGSSLAAGNRRKEEEMGEGALGPRNPCAHLGDARLCPRQQRQLLEAPPSKQPTVRAGRCRLPLPDSTNKNTECSVKL